MKAAVALLVLGMHRSGTSALTGALGIAGVSLGRDLKAPGPDNPKGFWELEPAVQVHEALLSRLGRSWDDVRPLPAGWLGDSASVEASRAIECILDEEFRGVQLWAVKDPRLCRFVPLWRQVLLARGLETRAVIVTRSPDEVAASLQARNRLPLPIGRALWGRYMADAVRGSEGMERCVVKYDTLLARGVQTLESIASLLHVPLRTGERARREIEAFLTPGLKHHEIGFPTQCVDAPAQLCDALDVAEHTGDFRQAKAASEVFEAQWCNPETAEALVGLVQEERQRTAVRMSELTVAQGALDEANRWGLRKDAELAEALAAADSLRHELECSTRWGASRDREVLAKDAELREALHAQGYLREQLAEVTRWGTAKDCELVEALAVSESLRQELALSTGWGESRDRELQETTARLQALQREQDSIRKRFEEARARCATLESEQLASAAMIDTLRTDLARKQAEMDEMNGKLRQEIEHLAGEMRGLLDRQEAQARTVEQLASKQAEANALRWQTEQLGARITGLEAQLREAGLRNALRRGWASFLLRAKVLTKRAIIAGALALPGPEQRKQARLDRLRVLNETCRRGVNSRSIVEDLHALAQGRWPARPAFLMRTPVEVEPPPIDVSVVLYESQRWIPDFLESVLASDYPLDRIHLLVRDHSTSTASADALEAYADRLRGVLGSYAYSRGSNAGFGAGHNHNFARSGSQLFLVTNVDGRFRTDTLRSVARATATSLPSVAAWELRQVPYEHPKYYDPVTLLTTWVTGACVMFRRDAFARVGGFDDAIFMYGEDVDLSYRLRACGFDLAYVPHAVFQHDSYKEPGEFKRLQFHGSTLANALLRLRFGSFADIAAIPSMWKRLATTASQLHEQRNFRRNLMKLIRLSPRFLFSRPGLRRIRVPFVEWDYGLRRDGAFEFIEPSLADAPPVSIVVRTYRGREGLLRQALATVANQTYANVEAVVVEDKGSTLRHTVEEVAAEFGLTVRYVACTEAESNRCITGSGGLAAAAGDYLNFLDDDDLLFADHVEYLASRLQAAPEAPACYALTWEARLAPDPVRPGVSWEVMHLTIDGHRREFDRAILSLFNFMPIQAVMFRRELYATYGGFDARLENLEDWELWRRYSLAGDFRYCPKTTSVYHVPHDAAIQAERQARLDAYLPIAHQVADEAREKFARKADA